MSPSTPVSTYTYPAARINDPREHRSPAANAAIVDGVGCATRPASNRS